MIIINIYDDLKKIQEVKFFSKMGLLDIQEESLILVKNVEKAFINPSDHDFRGLYKDVEWLPTSPTQEDPFYKKKSNPEDLVAARLAINKAILNSTKNISKENFIFEKHDFWQAASGAICFAFRQYIFEKYFDLGDRWAKVVEVYYSGHWPIGYFRNGLVAI